MNECMCSQRSAEGVRALRTDCFVFTQVLTWALHGLASVIWSYCPIFMAHPHTEQSYL